MRPSVPTQLEKGRVKDPPGSRWYSEPGEWTGRFVVRSPHDPGVYLLIVTDPGDPAEWAAERLPPPQWEHVSVSVLRDGGPAGRCPTWEEMCFVKRLCWADHEAAVQYHPPAAENVSFHPECLHIWRPVGVEVPRPPHICVGPLAEGGAR